MKNTKMNTSKSMMAYLLGGILVVTSTTIADAAMSRAEIEKKFIGKSLKFRTKAGLTGRVKHSRNGKSRLSNTNFSVKRDAGSWRFKGSRHCVSWKVIRKGKEKCFTISDTGNGTFRTHDGTKLFR